MRKLTLYLLANLIPFCAYNQNCLNAGFEDGSLSGYTTYLGRISTNGTVTIETPGSNDRQHKIMHISDGFDPIAENFCSENKLLPVVPPDAGEYTLRLGNSSSGAQAERVLLNFTVTPELTFFLLRYAVILNDPNHAPFEQPRFELRILDENGQIFPCGEYQVRSAENIPGFETCSGNWRVRPWTTVGFELQSFLGQNIQIEILTTDCAQGGHAGYAYLDVSCQPLEINLEGYCPDNTDCTMRVTDGFINYKWNTGDTTNAINIQNPLAGTAYQVTVTSATGCTLVLSETIPNLEELPKPVFSSEPDRTFCRDTAIWFQPKGQHLNKIHSPNLEKTADSFLLKTAITTNYSFIATDSYGCQSDTLQFRIKIAPPTISSKIDSLECTGDSNGQIQLAVQSDFLPIQYKWDSGPSTATMTNLTKGTYTVTISDNIHCTNTATFTLLEPDSLILDLFEINPIICHGAADGKVGISSKGGIPPYALEMNNQPYFKAAIDNLSAGNYSFSLMDANGCSTKKNIQLINPLPIKIDAVATAVSCFGDTDGTINLIIEGGRPNYQISWNDARYEGENNMTGLMAGDYITTITDELGCTITKKVTVFEPPFNKDCGTFIPNTFSPNADGLNDAFYVAGSRNGIRVENMEIYNRWGELVFKNAPNCQEIGNAACGWSGLINNREAPTSVYIYVIAIRFPKMSEPVIYKGTVQLVK